MSKPKCVLYSPVGSLSGYGAAGRGIAKAMIDNYKDEWDIKIIPCGWGNLPIDFIDNNEDWKWLEEYFLDEKLTYQPDLMFWHTIPTEAKPIGKWNCLFTAGIETTICAPQWIESANMMDLIVVPSKHSKDVFLNSKFQKKDTNTGNVVGQTELNKPIEVLFEGYFEDVYKHIPNLSKISKVKTEIDQIKEDFVFLSVGNWTPGIINEERKNISGLIKVFLETFKNNKNKPALLLKTHIGSSSITDRDEILSRIDKIKKTVKSKDLPKIYLIHGDLTDIEMNELYNHSKVKAMVSLTKGEGWGKPLLEFTQSKKPIICSGWGGQIDFLNDKYTTLIPGSLTAINKSAQVKDMLIEGSLWFSADLGIAGGYMKDYFENYKKYQDNGKRLGFYTSENFTYSKMVFKMKEILDSKVVLPYTIKMPSLRKV